MDRLLYGGSGRRERHREWARELKTHRDAEPPLAAYSTANNARGRPDLNQRHRNVASDGDLSRLETIRSDQLPPRNEVFGGRQCPGQSESRGRLHVEADLGYDTVRHTSRLSPDAVSSPALRRELDRRLGAPRAKRRQVPQPQRRQSGGHGRRHPAHTHVGASQLVMEDGVCMGLLPVRERRPGALAPAPVPAPAPAPAARRRGYEEAPPVARAFLNRVVAEVERRSADFPGSGTHAVLARLFAERGVLSLSAMRAVAAGLQMALSEEDVVTLFRFLDADGRGSVDFAEFVGAVDDALRHRNARAAAQEDQRFLRPALSQSAPRSVLNVARRLLAIADAQQCPQRLALMRMFSVMDADGNGRLQRPEIEELCRAHCGLDLRPAQTDELMRFFDPDGNGSVSFVHFAQQLLALASQDAAQEGGFEYAHEWSGAGALMHASASAPSLLRQAQSPQARSDGFQYHMAGFEEAQHVPAPVGNPMRARPLREQERTVMGLLTSPGPHEGHFGIRISDQFVEHATPLNRVPPGLR